LTAVPLRFLLPHTQLNLRCALSCCTPPMPRKPTGEPPGRKGYLTTAQREWLNHAGKDFKVGVTKEDKEANSNFYFETAKAFVRTFDTYASGYPEKEAEAKLDRTAELPPGETAPMITQDVQSKASEARAFLLNNLVKVSPS
jgi:hypothetical protein